MSSLTLSIAFLGSVLCLCSAIGWSSFWSTAQWDVRLILGLGTQGLIAFFCAALGIWELPAMICLVLVGGTLFVWKCRAISLPSIEEGARWIISGIALCTLIDALVPLIDTDALYYHMALAKQLAIRGELLGGWLHPNGSRPMLLHMSYSLVYGLAGENGPRIFYWLLSMAMLTSIADRSPHASWVLLLLVSSWSFIQELGVLSNNLPTAFALFLTRR